MLRRLVPGLGDKSERTAVFELAAQYVFYIKKKVMKQIGMPWFKPFDSEIPRSVPPTMASSLPAMRVAT